MKKTTLIIIVIFHSVLLPGQNLNCRLRLIRNVEEISGHTEESLFIKSIRHTYKHEDSIFIKTKDNKKLLIANKLVWGYQDSKCALYRNIFNNFYRIENISDSLVIYLTASEGFRGRTILSYYFSKNLNGPVYKLDKNNIHSQFQDNSKLINRLERQYSL